MYLPFFREGEKISGSGREGFGGEVGSAGSMKWGRCGALAGVEVTAAMLGNGAGVRGGGTLKRCVVALDTGAGVDGSDGRWSDGELAGDMRRRLFVWTDSKSISSSWSSPCLSQRPSCVSPPSMDCITCSPCSSSCASDWLDCDGSSILSTLSNFLRSFGSGVACANASSCGSSCLSLVTSCVCRGGAKTKRFAGVNFLNCSSCFG